MSKHDGYIKLILKDAIVEEKPGFSFFGRREPTDLWSVLRMIDCAARLPGVKGLFLVVKNPGIGWAQSEELAEVLTGFRKAGKKYYVYLESADNRLYYLASGAERIYLPPSGSLDLVGLRAELFFFRNLLEWLGVDPELFSFGEFKSAAEVFMRENMSDASRLVADSLLTDIQTRLANSVASNRGVSPETVQAWIDDGPYTAARALDAKLVDGIGYEDEVEDLLRAELRDPIEVPLSDVIPSERFLKRLVTYRRASVAIVYLDGAISSGEAKRIPGGRRVVSAEQASTLLRAVRKNRRIKAVVLRINSPGGSALASDLIWREVILTDQAKPVIVSFSNVAASGGYYVAVAGRRILGMPSTLTGSIGVVGGKFSLAGLLAKLGVTVDTIEKGRHSGYLSVSRRFSDSERQHVEESMRHFYEGLFLKKVAQGRRRSVEEIRNVAEGRVWTGQQAVENGLLDEIGGVTRAIELAREAAGLAGRKVRIVRLARKVRLLDWLKTPFSEAVPSVSSSERFWLQMPDIDIR